MAEQAYAYVTLIPVATGFQKTIASELAGSGAVGAKTGKDIGKKLSNGFNSSTNGIGSTLAKGLAAAGIAISIGGIANALKNATKAASDDAKGQILLAQQLRNTSGASREQIDAIEASIAKMAVMSGVADDQLRPALASLVRATGDATSAQSLLSLSLDVSAATGKDVQSVSLAIGKAVAGQTSQLFRMIPALKGSDDWMGRLKDQTQGMAKAAGDADPYMRLTIIFDEMQETIGNALLPSLTRFSDWISGPDGTQLINGLTTSFANFVGEAEDAGFAVKYFAEVAGKALADAGVDVKIDKTAESVLTLGQVVGGFVSGGGASLIQWFQIFGLIGGALQGQEAAKAADLLDTKKYTDETSRLLARRVVPTVTTKGPGPGPSGASVKTKAQIQAELMKDFASKVMDGFVEGLTESEESLKTTSKKAMDFISAAFTDKKLTKSAAQAAHAMVRSYTRALQPLVAEHAAVVKKLEAANDVLAKKIEERLSYIQDISAKYGSTLNIEEATTASDAIKALTDRIARTKDLSIAMAKLQELGLSGDLYQQILDSGNLEFAQSVIAGGEATVKELSDLAAQANTTALKLGEDAGDILYNKGIEVAQGVVDGLEARKTELEAQMKFLAEAFGKELTAIIAGVSTSFNGVTKMPVPTTGGGLSATSLSAQQASLRASLTALGAVDPKKNAQTYAQARALMTEIRSIESQKTALANTTLVYNAAENKSLNAEADLQQAITFSGLVG